MASDLLLSVLSLPVAPGMAPVPMGPSTPGDAFAPLLDGLVGPDGMRPICVMRPPPEPAPTDGTTLPPGGETMPDLPPTRPPIPFAPAAAVPIVQVPTAGQSGVSPPVQVARLATPKSAQVSPPKSAISDSAGPDKRATSDTADPGVAPAVPLSMAPPMPEQAMAAARRGAVPSLHSAAFPGRPVPSMLQPSGGPDQDGETDVGGNERPRTQEAADPVVSAPQAPAIEASLPALAASAPVVAHDAARSAATVREPAAVPAGVDGSSPSSTPASAVLASLAPPAAADRVPAPPGHPTMPVLPSLPAAIPTPQGTSTPPSAVPPAPIAARAGLPDMPPHPWPSAETPHPALAPPRPEEQPVRESMPGLPAPPIGPAAPLQLHRPVAPISAERAATSPSPQPHAAQLAVAPSEGRPALPPATPARTPDPRVDPLVSAGPERRAARPASLPPAAIQPAGQAFGAALQKAWAAERKPAARTFDALALLAPQADPAAPTTAPAPPTLDTADRGWPQAMAERIERLQDAADATSTRIRLLPDALGAIDVAVRREGELVHVQFTAAEAQTRQLLSDAQPRLAEAADARGLRLGRTDVSGGELSGQERQGDRQQRHPSQASQSPRPAPRRAVERDSATDTRIA